MEENRSRPTGTEITAYSFASFGHSLLGSVISTFLLYYYTDVRLLPPWEVGVLLFVINIFDGACDTFISYWMDKRRRKGGMYRDYLRYWSVPCCVLFALIFQPFALPERWALLQSFLLLLLWCFASSAVQSAILPLLVTITRDPTERYRINTGKVTGAVVSSLTARYLTLQLVALLGGGVEQRGFSLTAVIFALVGLVSILPASKIVRERNPVGFNRLPFRESLESLIHNRQLVLLFLMFFSHQFGSAVKGQASLYYLKYNLGREDMISLYLLTGVVCSLVMQPLVTVGAKKFGPAPLMLLGYLGAGASLVYIGMYGTTVSHLMVGNALYGIATAFPANLVYVCAADLADRHARGKANLNATINSLLGLSSRIGYSFGGAAIALVLSLTGYSPNQSQDALSLRGIRICYTGVSVLAYLAAVLMAAFILRQALTDLKQAKERHG